MEGARVFTDTTSVTNEDGCIKPTVRNTLFFCTYGLPDFNPSLVSAAQITLFRTVCLLIMLYLEPHM